MSLNSPLTNGSDVEAMLERSCKSSTVIGRYGHDMVLSPSPSLTLEALRSYVPEFNAKYREIIRSIPSELSDYAEPIKCDIYLVYKCLQEYQAKLNLNIVYKTFGKTPDFIYNFK